MDRQMTAASPSLPTHDVTREAAVSAVSWAAVIAGSVVAIASTLILLAVGSGLGFASVSPWPGSGVSAVTFSIVTAIWLIVVQWLSSALGGYLTGRLRSKWVNTHTHEVFFRDTAHGVLMWALATVLGAALLASAVSSAAGAGVRAAAEASSGTTSRTTSAVSPYDVDALFRTTRGDAAGSPSSASAEAARILGNALTTGNMPAADRDYLVQLVGARTGISQDEAQRRVDAVITHVREAADAARKASAMASIYLALSMLIGAFIAGVCAAIGGRLRDSHP